MILVSRERRRLLVGAMGGPMWCACAASTAGTSSCTGPGTPRTARAAITAAEFTELPYYGLAPA